MGVKLSVLGENDDSHCDIHASSVRHYEDHNEHTSHAQQGGCASIAVEKACSRLACGQQRSLLQMWAK